MMSLVTAKDGSATLNKARRMVCMEAAWEIGAIASMLPDTIDASDVDSMNARLRVRCIAGRLRELANALMAGLDDEAVSVEGLSGLNCKVLLSEEVAA